MRTASSLEIKMKLSDLFVAHIIDGFKDAMVLVVAVNKIMCDAFP